MANPVARECWNVAVEELWERGLRRADLLELRLMCEQYAVAHEAANGRFGFQVVGIVIPDPRGDIIEPDPDRPGELRTRHTAFMPNPTVRLGRDAANTFMRMAASFGLDVASRMRLGLMVLSGQSLADALMEELERD
jgi:phage terminase small subunit